MNTQTDELCHEKTCFVSCENKGADQPDQRLFNSLSRSYNVSSFYIQNFKPLAASVDPQAGLCLTWLQAHEDRFSRDET